MYCDRCGAAAKARYILENGDLVFCGHHARELNWPLLDQGATFDSDFELYTEELQPA